MGCAASVSTPSDLSGITHIWGVAQRHPRETRILQTVHVEGEWKRGLSAGGSRNNIEMFAHNPQFLLIVGQRSSAYSLPDTPTIRGSPSDITEEYSLNVKRFRIPVFISLSQTETKRPLHIAFFVYKTESMHERLEPEYFLCVSPEVQSGVYVNSPEVQRRCWLWPGLYVVVAAAFHPHHSGMFRLVVSSNRHLSLQPLEDRGHHSA
ncbi:calpain-11-like [Macrosteles quadrilineatus]|uniref:calpain-11-like n=1 Tax=Macrosteles quadrilineatus TaxID=74068 RepID=UPI0023E118F4|nr:calpain-11-like [Macrosteles quadrilineatus]